MVRHRTLALLALPLTVAVVLASPSASAAPLVPKIGRCWPVGKKDASNGYGNTAATRVTRLEFGYTWPDANIDAAAKALARKDTKTIELCFATDAYPGGAYCPYFATGADEWLVYEEGVKGVLPPDDEIVEPGETITIQPPFSAPEFFEWGALANEGRVLALLVNGQLINMYDHGFCPASYPLAESAAPTPDSARFEIVGVRDTITTLSGLGIDPCADGEKTDIFSGQACVDQTRADFLLEILDKLERAQQEEMMPPTVTDPASATRECRRRGS